MAAPVFVEQALTNLVGQTDTWLTGHYLEQEHLAAIGLMAYLLWMIPTMFATVAIGATAMTARFVGAGDWSSANRVLHQSLLIGVAFATVTSLGGWCLGDPLVRLLRLKGESADLAVEFLHIILWALPLLTFEIVGVACLRGAGYMGAGLLVMAGVNLVNIGVGASLMLGWGPFPQLGWRGLAIGTACGYIAGGVFVMALLCSRRWKLTFSPQLLVPDGDLIRRLLRVGVPGGLDQFGVICAHLWFLSFINELGIVPAAAHGVVLRVESLCYLPAVAFHCAAATLAGQYLGARDPQQADSSVRRAVLYGGGMMTAMGVAFFLFSAELPRVFISADQADVAAAAAPLLRIVAFSMPGLAALTIINGGLRGAGDTRWPMMLNLLGLFGVRIPLTWLLTQVYSFGVEGAWYAILADLTIRGALVALRFRHGGWLKTDV